ncbi:MAG: acyl-CoA thioesterase, partial [Sedimentisphaerales bacterium]|nr:acyl-CoA thioesterase [Sedimentisphaerales bacterium]
MEPVDSQRHPTVCTIPIRVRYCEVDRMNAVHHSRYAVYFEMGRTELLRANGYDYRALEEQGILLVIAKMEVRFKAPARYDDELELTCRLTRCDRVRIEHEYELVRP